MTKKQKIVYIYFIILPIIDVITSLITRFTDISLTPGVIIKGLTAIFAIIYIFVFSKSKYKKSSILYLSILILYFILYFITKMDIINVSTIINETTYALKYFYFPLMILGLLNIFEDFKINRPFIRKILFINCLSYTFFLLFPYVTGTGFNSYRYEGIFGNNGWFYAANETGAIMITLSSSIIYLLESNNKLELIHVLLIMFAITLIGTKVSYFGIIIVSLLALVFFIISKNKKENKVIGSIVIITFLLIACLMSSTPKNLSSHIDDVNNAGEETNEYNFKYNTIEDLGVSAATAKLIKIALSGREAFFLRNYSIYSEAPVKDKLFGLSWANREELNYNFKKKLIEIDGLDIVIHYGIIGFIIYFLPLIVCIIKFLKNIKSHNKEDWYYVIIISLVLAISSVAGHTLSSPATSIYLALLISLIANKNNKVKLNDDEITILALHLNYGGVEKYISSLCKMLDDKYKINLIVTYKINESPSFEFSNRVNITYLINKGPNKQEINDAIKSKKLIKIIKEGFKSIIILTQKKVKNIHAIKNIKSKYIITTREYHNNLVGLYADKDTIKIATEHNYHNNDQKYVKKIINSVKYFDYFILVSNNLKEYYQSKIPNTKCIYIPNVLDELPKKSTNLNKNVLINIGRLEEVKGQSDLIDIVKIVKEEIKNIKLYIVGDGSLKADLQEKIKKEKLEKNIILTGFLSQEEIGTYLSNSKLFVMTSYQESFGLVLIEAMSHKLPCIAYDCADGASELLKNNQGVLISNRNKEEMAKSIIELLKNQKKLTNLSNKSFKACQKFLLINVKKEWLEILQQNNKGGKQCPVNKKKRKNKIIKILLTIFLLIALAIGVIFITKIKEKRKQELLLQQEIFNHYNDYVLTNKQSIIYDNLNKEIGKVGKGVELKLSKISNETYKSKKYKIESLDKEYYIDYLDVSPINSIKEKESRYKNYIVFNENIITSEKTSFYDLEGKLIYSFNKSFNMPIIVKNEEYYGVEYNNELLYIKKSNIKEIVKSNNTKETNAQSIAALAYHFIYLNEEASLCRESICHSENQYRSHLNYLKENNYFTVKMKELEMYIDGSIQLPSKSVVLTIDDGSLAWNAKNILEEYKLNSTLFLITSWYDTGKYISDYLEIHSHGHNLHNAGLCSGGFGAPIKCMEETKLIEDLKESRRILNNTTVFCYPFYEYNNHAINALKKAGFTMAFAGYAADGKVKITVGANKFKLPRITITSNTTIEEFANYIKE